MFQQKINSSYKKECMNDMHVHSVCENKIYKNIEAQSGLSLQIIKL